MNLNWNWATGYIIGTIIGILANKLINYIRWDRKRK